MYREVDGVPIIERNRFSRFVVRRDELVQWLMDFQQAGIPCALVLTDAGYALYRTGMEDLLDDVDDE